MSKTNGTRFVVEFPLKTEIYQEHILEKRFEIGRHIYNSLLTVTWKRYKEMIKTKKYRDLQDSLKDATDDVRKTIYKQLQEIRREYRISEYDFYFDVKEMQRHFKQNIDSNTARTIASSLWKAYEKNLFSDGEQIHYKKKGQMRSLAGKDNKAGIRFHKDKRLMTWNGLNVPIKINETDNYKMEALECDVAYCRIIRKEIKGKIRYCLQVVLKGIPPVKYHKDTGEVKHPLGNGKVGLHIGLTNIAVVNADRAEVIELAKNSKEIADQIKEIEQKMDRSKRTMNPDNYNEDGTIKKEDGVKLVWKKSKRYQKLQSKRKELHRKETALRKYRYECLANEIIEAGDAFYINKLEARRIQQKGYGKTIQNRAPSMLVSIIERKLKYHEIEMVRTNEFELIKQVKENKDVPMDLYRAYINYHVNDDYKTVNEDAFKKDFQRLEK